MTAMLTSDLGRFLEGVRYEQLPPSTLPLVRNAGLAPFLHAFGQTLGHAPPGSSRGRETIGTVLVDETSRPISA